MTAGPLEQLVTGVDGLINPPLDFTKNLAGALQSKVIGALGAPQPLPAPIEAYRYTRARSQLLIDSARQQPLVRLQDKNYNHLAPIAQEMSCYFEEIAADTGEAGVVIRGGDYLADFVRNAVRIEEDLHLSIDPIGTKPNWRTRWGGKITTINVKRDSSGIHTVELIASANREHLKNILIAATPFFPPEVQPLKLWLLPANIRTGCTITMLIQLARLFFPVTTVTSNLLNPFGWINPLSPDALLNFDPLSWPIQTQFINPFLDQSRTSLIVAAWNDFHSATVDQLKDAGCTARVYTWFTEDEDSPHPELEKLVGPQLASLARPHRNCLVTAFEDHSGYAGPTGTAVDGVINFFASTLDDLITTTVFPVDTDNDGEIDPVFRKLFLVAPPKPWAVFHEGQHSGIIESGYHQHKGPVKTTMTGGKSPRIVNDLQCVSADTVIEGPDGNERVDVLAAHGRPFRVWSVTPEGVRVPATATHAFRKGTAELFEYRLDDGRSIKATGHHRFLTSHGFVCGAEVVDETMIATVDEFSTPSLYVPARAVNDAEYGDIAETAAVKFRKIVDVHSVGVNDFYDMHVPGWENYAANGFWNHNTFGIRYGISQLAQVILGVEAPGVEGLDNLYQGQLDNILFAHQRYTNPIRALFTGDTAFQEHYVHPGGTAWTLSGILALRDGDFKKRAFRSFKTSIRNGAPYIINHDIMLDDRVGFEQDGIIYVDQVSAIKYEYDRQKPITYTVSVGDDTQETDPFAQGIKALQAVYTLLSAVLGEGLLF